jgi:hypothetical protein
MTFYNPYALTPEEQKQVDAWEAMDDGDKGEYLHRMKQEHNIQDISASIDYWDRINDLPTQRLAGGGAQVGGELRPDALLTIDGVEMTAQQAVDVGIRSSLSIGKQVADLD